MVTVFPNILNYGIKIEKGYVDFSQLASTDARVIKAGTSRRGSSATASTPASNRALPIVLSNCRRRKFLSGVHAARPPQQRSSPSSSARSRRTDASQSGPGARTAPRSTGPVGRPPSAAADPRDPRSAAGPTLAAEASNTVLRSVSLELWPRAVVSAESPAVSHQKQ